MAKRSAGAGTPASTALAAAGIPFTLHPYEHDPAAPSYGLEAAEALGVDPERVFKTLLADTELGIVVGVVPVTGMLDLKALAAAVGAKRAAMADPAVAERRTGYVVGGISPIGQKTQHVTVVDESPPPTSSPRPARRTPPSPSSEAGCRGDQAETTRPSSAGDSRRSLTGTMRTV